MLMEEQKEIIKRLDVIISILLETSRPGGKEIPATKKIQILDEAGLRPVDISKILGWSISSVTSEITKIRKLKKKRVGKYK